MPNSYRSHWRLNPEIDYLNHGSFGATPTVVRETHRDWIDQLERDPIEFLAPERSLLPKLDLVRNRVADLLNAAASDVVFVRNATDGVNAVLRSFPFRPGDEVVVTSHGYNACNNAAKFAAERAGASVVTAEIPFPIDNASAIIDAIQAKTTNKTRLLLIDHVTSPSALVFPVADLIDMAHSRGVRVMVDGAHAPGMLPIDLSQLKPDYYTANHHKWLCCPKTSGCLYVQPEFQSEVRPTVISHGANTDSLGDSKFQGEFNWIGTYDPTPLLSVPAALDFLNELKSGGLDQVMQDNRALALAARTLLLESLELDSPAPAEMIGSLATIPLPKQLADTPDQSRALQQRLYKEHRIEVPVFQLHGAAPCLRVSAQAYNSIDQYDRLADALQNELRITSLSAQEMA